MPTIPFSNQHGANPAIELCAWCGKDTGTILLAGRSNRYACPSCKAEFYGRGTLADCPNCKTRVGRAEFDVEVPRQMRGNGLCDDCAKKAEEQKTVVAEGGIYWRCEDCRSEGAIRAHAELAKDVRRYTKIEPPAPCGVTFDEKTCPVCGPGPAKEA